MVAPLIEFDLAERLATILGLDRGRRALQMEGRWYSWGDLADGAAALEEALSDAGLSGDALPIGVVMRNAPSTVAAALGIITSGHAIVTLSDLQPNDRLAQSIRSVAVAAVVAHPADWTAATLTAARDQGVLGVSVSPDEPSEIAIVSPLRLTPEQVDERRRPGVALEMMTSGTTGMPKRIPLSYSSLASAISGALHYASGQDSRPTLRKSVAVVALPLLHMGGIWTTLLNYCTGRAVAMLPRFDVSRWVELIREHRPIVANVPPAALQMLIERDVPQEDLASLKALTVGTAPLSPELAERFEDHYGIAVLAVYGATEFAGGVAGWTLADRKRFAKSKRGSVGRAHGDVTLRVVDSDSGEPLPFGDVGLLELRAPQLVTDRDDGWMRTNDLATVDEDGFLWIRGRADDAIIRGGFKISAGEVAEVLRRHPDVRDAAVVGMPDDRLGEVPVAAVEPMVPGTEVDGEAVRAFAREHLTPYQVPAEVVSVDALPRGAGLKVNAAEVRELIAERRTQKAAT